MQRKKAKRQAANGYGSLKSGAHRLLGQTGGVRNGVLKKVRVAGLPPISLFMSERWLSDSAGQGPSSSLAQSAPTPDGVRPKLWVCWSLQAPGRPQQAQLPS